LLISKVFPSPPALESTSLQKCPLVLFAERVHRPGKKKIKFPSFKVGSEVLPESLEERRTTITYKKRSGNKAKK
jgi:hypothetical protein